MNGEENIAGIEEKKYFGLRREEERDSRKLGRAQNVA